MPSWLSRLRGLVWTSILAVTISIISVVAAVFGADDSVWQSAGIFAIVLAILAPKA